EVLAEGVMELERIDHQERRPHLFRLESEQRQRRFEPSDGHGRGRGQPAQFQDTVVGVVQNDAPLIAHAFGRHSRLPSYSRGSEQAARPGLLPCPGRVATAPINNQMVVYWARYTTI